MKLHAHISADGRIEGLVAMPDGKVAAGLVMDPTLQVCEIGDHGLKGDGDDIGKLEKLLDSHTVKLTPARGKLVRRKRPA